MIDKKKIMILRIIGIVLLATLFFFIGNSFGLQRGKSVGVKTAQEQKKESKKKDNSNKQDVLTQKYVEDFLVAKYTRKDLGENRKLYKPFMTDGMYLATTNEEDKPVNQAYKGLTIDQEFVSADIYIDNKNDKVIADVNFKNTQLSSKEKDAQKLENQPGRSTVLITYVKDTNGKLLVNDMKNISIGDSNE